jgi:hypothetical protein
MGEDDAESGQRRHRCGAVERIGPGHRYLGSAAGQANREQKETATPVGPPLYQAMPRATNAPMKNRAAVISSQGRWRAPSRVHTFIPAKNS